MRRRTRQRRQLAESRWRPCVRGYNGPRACRCLECFGARILPENRGYARPGPHGRAFVRPPPEPFSRPSWPTDPARSWLGCSSPGRTGGPRLRRRLCCAPLSHRGAEGPLWRGHGAAVLCGSPQKRQNRISFSGAPAADLRQLPVPTLRYGSLLVSAAPSRTAHRHLTASAYAAPYLPFLSPFTVLPPAALARN